MTLIQKLAYKAIEAINGQILAGKDIDGNNYAYSTKPFFRPYDSKIAAKLGGKKNAGITYKIINKEGRMGMIIMGGYKAYRQAYGRATEGDFLQFTGKMLASLDIIKSNENSAEIGFNDKTAAQIAFWLNVSGAGKSRKLWKFFGLNKNSQQLLADLGGVASQKDIQEMVDKLLF